jgi:large subunit ribosomal protein L2
MATLITRPTSPGRRHQVRNVSSDLSNVNSPHKKLLGKTTKRSGRNSAGRVTVRRRGGGHKKKVRKIDFNRSKFDIPGKVLSIEYDPNRSAHIALIVYADGEKSYILSPNGLKENDVIISSKKAEPKVGNAMPLSEIPVGTPIHGIELRPNKGAQLVRGAGSAATIQSHEDKYAAILLPSKEIRLVDQDCFATIGQVGNVEHKNRKIGKAGRKRHMGIRPSVRGVAMHPGAHPHGGGEGRSGIGMPSPKTPWGKKALGKKTRTKGKHSNKMIIRDRRRK